MKITPLIFTVGLLMPLCAHAQFLSLGATGYNADIIVGGNEVANSGNATTATIDGGNANSTLYSQGFNTASPTTGLPTSITAADGTPFTFQSPTLSNAVYNGGTLTLTTPRAFTSLALIGLSGNSGNATAVTVTVNYAGGTSQTFGPGLAAVQDWFNNTNNLAFTLSGRVNVSNNSFDAVGSNNPRLYDSILTLNNTTAAVTSVTINNNGINSEAILAISGNVPEPSSVMYLIGASALGLGVFLRRRSRGTVA